jgi:N-acetylglucosaminyldiphosphoundecaprenol N-acetyl-beta-D-mannosaminyltransferase
MSQLLNNALEEGQGRVWSLGLPLVPWTEEQVVDSVESLIRGREPSFFITANLNYAMLTMRSHELAAVNGRAAFLVADGMPLLWCARRRGISIPQRIAGSDLIYSLARMACDRGYRIFLLGASPGVAVQAASSLMNRYPGLQIAGVESPGPDDLCGIRNTQLVERIRQAQPDLLLVALGQPKGELWIDRNCQALAVPVSVQVGASFDFIAGTLRRAPGWIQRSGLEWLHRLWQEPRRLTRRYLENGVFLLRNWFRQAGRDLL